MSATLLSRAARLTGLVACALSSCAAVENASPAASPVTGSGALLTPGRFDSLREDIRPGERESLWEQIPWLLSVHEARKRAAAEGKPILLWSAGGCCPLGGC
jgi:hypothetical protein